MPANLKLMPVPDARSRWEEELWLWLRHRWPDVEWLREYRFHATRMWRFDFAAPASRIAVEVEGMVPGGRSRHTSMRGYAGDCRKYNAAAAAGWRVIRGTQTMIRSGDMHADIEMAMEERTA